MTHPNFGSPSEAPSKSLQAADEDKEILITTKTMQKVHFMCMKLERLDQFYRKQTGHNCGIQIKVAFKSLSEHGPE